MSATASSSISSTSYQSVEHKKNVGRIILNDANFTFYPAVAGGSVKAITWSAMCKHQVSPITHARFLLKVVVLAAEAAKAGLANSLTFELKSREELERIRQDVSTRLTGYRRTQAQNTAQAQSSGGLKRGFEESSPSSSAAASALTPASAAAGERHGKKPRLVSQPGSGSLSTSAPAPAPTSTSTCPFTTLSATALAVTCSSLLSSDPTLRAHYSVLVLGQPPPFTAAIACIINPHNLTLAPILSESDFWLTHKSLLANHAAKTFGIVSYGISSAMKSSLDLDGIGTRTPILLGVEEMRQIFILYPAVHKAYEAMVPLELSEEQFWRKYLESEYFHRDRGRLNTHFEKRLRSAPASATDKKDDDGEHQLHTSTLANPNDASAADAPDSALANKEEAKTSEENARIAAASSNDIFSRTELELQVERSKRLSPARRLSAAARARTPLGSNLALAIGQFDLAATANTERGSKLLLYSNESNKPSAATATTENTKGSKVIEKYNRHWAIVMNPEIATAGCNLIDLARESVTYTLHGDDDAKVAGGVGREMARLVGFAGASEGRVDHVKGMGDPVNDENTANGKWEGGSSLFQELNLRTPELPPTNTEQKDHLDVFPSLVLDSVRKYDTDTASREGHSFPEPKFGRNLLSGLTKRMKNDSITESHTINMTNQLDDNFRKKLTLYFHRATELLKHFFALRRVMEIEKKSGNTRGKDGHKFSEKLTKVVDCMKQVYDEIDEMRKDMPQMMRTMCYDSIMSQLTDACEDTRISGDGGGGGFITVAD